MKVLIVCSGNAKNFSFQINQAFIYDQVNAIKKLNDKIEFDYFFIKGKGWKGYLKNLKQLREKIKIGDHSFIHAHSGDSVLLASLQRIIPVVGTYHGSDLNRKKNRVLSNIANILSKKSIVVSNKLYRKLWFKKDAQVIPCGVDFDLFYPESKEKARKLLNVPMDKAVILFSSAFTNTVKNYPLAESAINLTGYTEALVIELKGYKRNQIKDLMNAADLALMTSFREGSPQFIKEAMACNVPIVSTDVGDVRDNIGKIEGCFIASFDVNDVAQKIESAMMFKGKTKGRDYVRFLDNKIIAKKIIHLYNKVSL